MGSIRSFNEQIVVLRDRLEVDRPLRNQPGGFLVDGEPATLVAPTPVPRPAAVTASGSVAAAARPARVARASRILVEGIHDAELVEKVWGDDLRELGVVVERLDGMDDLADVVRDLDPGPGRRLGVLLDHLVDRSKESRAAAAGPPPARPGHRDAVRRRVGGDPTWRGRASTPGPRFPAACRGRPGVLDALGIDVHPGAFWKQLLGQVQTYADLDPSLVGAVEQLIDFVVDDDAA